MAESAMCMMPSAGWMFTTDLNGGERVSVERPDHSRIVAERGRAGYVQRPYTSSRARICAAHILL